MSWDFVYNELKNHLNDEEFKEKDLRSNPNHPEDAILVALYQLHKEYSGKATEECRREYGI